MAAKRKKTPEEKDLVCLKLVRAVTPFLNQLKEKDPPHGNTDLTVTDTLIVLLCAFFNPTVRSLRLVEQLSQMPWAQEQLDIERVCRSTVSDALGRFDPEVLIPVINGLLEQMPHLKNADPDLARICKRVIAGDGSNFNLAADVAWALTRSRGGKDPTPLGYCRLNLQLEVDHFVPAELSVSGNDEGSEAAAFQKKILPGVIYLFDRNFVHFGLINTVIDRGSDLVLRLRKDTNFQATAENVLCDRDKELRVTSDRIGILPGSPGVRTGAPPTQTLREVLILGDDGKVIRLLTTLLDVPAYVISALYRQRWQIELFFRWLKVWAGFQHLMSHSKRGVTFSFYVAVIGCLLMHVRTGRKVNKYSLFLFGQVAAGHATLEQILPMLERIEREKELERQRLAKKRKEKELSGKISAQLPG